MAESGAKHQNPNQITNIIHTPPFFLFTLLAAETLGRISTYWFHWQRFTIAFLCLKISHKTIKLQISTRAFHVNDKFQELSMNAGLEW
jgi:hypothetical protein